MGPKNTSPEMSEEQTLSLVAQIKDWQVQTETECSVSTHPVGVSKWGLQCFPTPWPRAKFQQALEIQEIYNRLYCAVAEDEQWIYGAIRDILPVEPLAAALWGIYEAARETGLVQNVSVGIFRSDYMLHLNAGTRPDSPGAMFETSLKQIELNTFSCSGAAHANKVGDMHRYLARTGIYNVGGTTLDIPSLPVNHNIATLASGLALAHATYGGPRSKEAKETAVLMVVQPFNFNIADERPIEYALWNRSDPVPTYRLDFGPDVLEHTWLTEERELLYHPPWQASTTPVEISVVYLRAGYEAHEYDHVGWEARLQLETSVAIKCPSLLSHMTTFKKVQQALTVPGALETFLSESEAAALRETFVPVYPLDESEQGRYARDRACDPVQSAHYILKPSLEGGGHNVYGTDIPGYLASMPQSKWCSYILMERVQPPLQHGLLMSPAGIDSGEVVSELGVLGCCLWQSNHTSDRRCTMLHNSVGGWTFKTKYAEIDEMSVVKGYGCFDTPRLMDS
ncbi:uncharacterized protein N7482_009049 [Penicillium canariense]|uniref:Glutathione synthetase n=1 Tax=Penicillium canariense TaxID=189055 RepID=A0A9W9LEC4_9EURO|nr:uncharacterized protein N7482_009049 [Penicillium canariense]KAJ5152571.1 hypothetical protein N7482_009049 [Penicillium canariense]